MAEQPVRRRQHARPPRQAAPLTRMEQALFAAKNAGREVRFIIAVETPYTDEHYSVQGTVDQVDKYDVSLKLPHGIVWFRKMFIVTTEIL